MRPWTVAVLAFQGGPLGAPSWHLSTGELMESRARPLWHYWRAQSLGRDRSTCNRLNSWIFSLLCRNSKNAASNLMSSHLMLC